MRLKKVSEVALLTIKYWIE